MVGVVSRPRSFFSSSSFLEVYTRCSNSEARSWTLECPKRRLFSRRGQVQCQDMWQDPNPRVVARDFLMRNIVSFEKTEGWRHSDMRSMEGTTPCFFKNNSFVHDHDVATLPIIPSQPQARRAIPESESTYLTWCNLASPPG